MRRLAIAAVVLATAATVLAPTAQAATGLTATFTRTGTQAKVVVANSTATAVTGWSIRFDLPAGVTVSGAQNATTTQTGTRVTLTPAYYINTIGAGRNTEPYSPTFVLSAAVDPTACTINGANCDGTGDPAPPPAPTTASFSLSATTGKFVVNNNTDAVLTSWSIVFELPAGVTASGAQHSTLTQNGRQVTLVPLYYNKSVAARGSTEPYSPTFTLSSAVEPTSCRINDSRCDGAADTPPAAPSNLRSPVKTTRTASLTWDAATPGSLPLNGYNVYQGTSLVTAVTGTTATVTGLTPNTAYLFTVKAKDSKGNLGPASAALAVTTNNPSDDTQAPTTPTGLRSTAVDSASVSLAWNASTDNRGVAGYDVYVGGVLNSTAAGTSAVVSGLSPSTAYSFTVRARDLYDNTSAPTAALQVSTADIIGSGYARVGYFVQWGIYGRQFFVKNLDTNGSAAKMTHLNYAFGNIDPVNLTCLQGVTKGTSANPQDPNQGDGAGDAEADYSRPFAAAQSVDGVADSGFESLRGNYNQLRKLKAKYPNLKVLISLGGWTYSKYFSDVAATDASRRKFVTSCLDTYILGNLPSYGGAGGPGSAAGIFDGIDIDWEWPGAEGHAGNHYSPADKANNTLLIAEFRRRSTRCRPPRASATRSPPSPRPTRRRSPQGGTWPRSRSPWTSSTSRATTSTARAATTRGSRTARATRATCTRTRTTRTRRSSASRPRSTPTRRRACHRARSRSGSRSTAAAGRAWPTAAARASGRRRPVRHRASSPRRRAPAGTRTWWRAFRGARLCTTRSRWPPTATPARAGSGGRSTTRGRSRRRPRGCGAGDCSARCSGRCPATPER